MDHEYTISGRIFPEPEQVKTTSEFQKFASKISWIEQDFESTGLKVDLTPCSAIVSMKSENIENPLLEQACVNLSLILDCTVMLCKHHEVYGVANVFNGGSDYEVIDEDCDLWICKKGTRQHSEHTKYWNEKFAEQERDFSKSDTAQAMLNLFKK